MQCNIFSFYSTVVTISYIITFLMIAEIESFNILIKYSVNHQNSTLLFCGNSILIIYSSENAEYTCSKCSYS